MHFLFFKLHLDTVKVYQQAKNGYIHQEVEKLLCYKETKKHTDTAENITVLHAGVMSGITSC